MIKLSERLKTIADFIKDGEDIADIGTDHGYLPLYLLEKNPSRKAIFTDVNEGPLSKNRAIINRENPDSHISDYDIRLGNGLEPLASGEVHTVIIAGMGGILIRDILSADKSKTRSFEKIILQPRTASDKLRKWLVEHNIFISNEDLAYEQGRICEIIVISPKSKQVNNEFTGELDFEFSPILIKKKNDIVRDWVARLIKKEKQIRKSIDQKGSLESSKKLVTIESRLSKLESINKNLI